MTRVLIVEARFYDDLADELLAGATEELEARGVPFDRVSVPGALEIPQIVALAAAGRKYAGAVALGCVIRGETSHYDIVAGESARALMDIAVSQHFAVGNGILTTDTGDQAWARARRSAGNKGRAAVVACLEVIAARSKMEAGRDQ